MTIGGPSPRWPAKMQAMRIHRTSNISQHSDPLVPDEVPVPMPSSNEVLIRVETCGVCHTELDEIEGRTPPSVFPMTPGHQVTGKIVQTGSECSRDLMDAKVGVAWIFSSCGVCDYCVTGQENLCREFLACGRDANGGYAEYMVIDENYIHRLPGTLSAISATPLLCAGAVGYRALAMCQLVNGQSLGLTGFGASGHLVLQMARHLYPASRICVFTRNPAEQDFARELGADWAGDTGDHAPFPAVAIIDTTPAWKPVRTALAQLTPGGRLIINAIRKEEKDKDELLKLNYEKHLWQEKSIHSVANVTRKDVRQCLDLAAEIQLEPEVTTYPLAQANRALQELKQGPQRGAKVLLVA